MTTFGDLLIEPLRNGLTRPKSVRGEGVAMVNMGELFAYGRITDATPMESVPLSDRESSFLLAEGDLLFARQSLVRDGAGKVSYFAGKARPTTFESHVIRARLDRRKADPRFWAYYFGSTVGRARIETIVEQVAAAGIRSSDLARLRVDAPGIQMQGRIADVLSALDNKIDVNRRIARTSEVLLRTMYGRIVECRSACLSEVVDFVRDGVDPSTLTPDTPYIGLEHMPQRSITLNEWGGSANLVSGKSRFKKGDVLFGKLRPYFHKVGIAPISGVCSQEILVLRARHPELVATAVVVASSDDLISHATAVSSGTRMPRVSWQDLAAFKVSIPARSALGEFNRLADPVLDLIAGLIHENRKLGELRDLLLPELISGRMTVN